MKTYKEWTGKNEGIEEIDPNAQPDVSIKYSYSIQQLQKAIEYLRNGSIRAAKDSISRALDRIY